ncbi:hypothetical protein [Sphingosinicella terrae]|uniref:hypothetical protein n=1 Tax=Sphingosinicella terrae TaxID=2172047 RepID=UPI000E0CE2EA|nr:hypothetical protein [Sphingosinicella terrae]
MRTGFLLLAALAACGSEGPSTGTQGGGADANQIRRLSTPPPAQGDVQAAVRLEPVTYAELEAEGVIGAGCAFTRGGVILLAAAGSDALIRVNGGLRHLVQSSVMGPTGGFFEDRQISVSVGRTDERGEAGEESTAWPARITVTNRRSNADIELDGEWSCGA